jgi:FeS assembly SUF system regulator
VSVLKISKLADYGSLIMNFLARHPEQFFNAAAVSEATHLSLPTVSKLLKLLSDAKILVSARGAAGGYRLARDVHHISLVELLMAIDGSPALTECSLGAKSCIQNDSCLVKHNWQMINALILKVLKNISVADMTQSLRHHPVLTSMEQLHG